MLASVDNGCSCCSYSTSLPRTITAGARFSCPNICYSSYSSQAFFGLGTGGLQIQIHLTGTPETHPYDIFYLRHRPSWKVRKNVFAALKSHGINSAPMLSPGDGGPQRIMAYSCYHDTEGEVTLSMAHGKKLDHMGIQVKFFGRIDMVSLVNVFLLIF